MEPQQEESEPMEYRLEAIVVPVSDVDRAKAFYEKLGFRLDVDHQPSDEFRVVQFTPPGSACSIVFGKGMPNEAEPGSYGGLHLVVTDVEAARADLAGRNVDVRDVPRVQRSRRQRVARPGGRPRSNVT